MLYIGVSKFENRGTYAGVGTRDGSQLFDDLIVEVAGNMVTRYGCCLHSGHADHSDKKFEQGCDESGGAKRIFLPWKNFNGATSGIVIEDTDILAYQIAELYHPRWDRVKPQSRPLMARNTFQVLGEDCKSPVTCVLAYTEGGEASGGTGQALRIAEAYGIPVFNFGAYRTAAEAKIAVYTFLDKVYGFDQD